MKRTAAATFVNIPVEELRKFLKSAFHALEPREMTGRGEIVINLPLSDTVTIKVFTSVAAGGSQAAGVGDDAIRVGLYRNGRPLKSGRWPIVKRTQGWRENLRERVEDMMEKYDSETEAIEKGAFVTWP
jgi:hypothetical protein